MPRDAHSTRRTLIEAADAALYASKRRGQEPRHGLRAGARRRARGRRRSADRGSAELAVLESLAHRVASLGDPRADRRADRARAAHAPSTTTTAACCCSTERGEWLEPVAVAGEPVRRGPPPARRCACASARRHHGAARRARPLAARRRRRVRIPRAHQLPGTAVLPEESLLAVPMRYDQRSMRRDRALQARARPSSRRRDRRLVEILASHAAVAFENAALSAARRRAAARADALLKLAADGAGRGTLRRRLRLLRRALGADWVAAARARDEPRRRASWSSASAVRPRDPRCPALRQLTLGRTRRRSSPRPARGDVRGLPREHAGVTTSLRLRARRRHGAARRRRLAGTSERELRTSLRELRDRLARAARRGRRRARSPRPAPRAQPRARTRRAPLAAHRGAAAGRPAAPRLLARARRARACA